MKILKSGVYVHGPKSKEFETKFKKLTNAKNAISVSSCTAGMHLIYFTLGIGKGDEVIVPAQLILQQPMQLNLQEQNRFL